VELDGSRMASREPLYLHKETRLSFEPPSSSLIVDIKLPSVSSQGRGRTNNGGNDKALGDESLFRDRFCATASSIYRRQHHASPKSFLWRVLENNTVLSIRVVDVTKVKKAADANLILNFRFPRPIRPHCVALADSVDHDSLSVFAIDATNHLYTLTLRPEFFRKRSSTEGSFDDHVKIHNSPAFGIRAPHRLVAFNDDVLLATVYDGGNVRLSRNKSHDGKSKGAALEVFEDVAFNTD
jgi:nuclear pore complex protein Nup160